MRRVSKVVVYITHGTKLLVFTHRDYPAVGVQVPAGTVEAGEDFSKAALREAEEETGLENLRLIGFLGTCDFDASIFRPEIHERHFYHLEAQDIPVAESWLHYEMKPSGGDGKPIAYNLYWVEKDKAELFAEQGAFLRKI